MQIEGDAITRWETEGEDVAGPRATVAPGTVKAGSGASATGMSATAHGRLLADFVAAIQDGRPPLVPGPEGRRSLALVLAIYEAARTGRATRPAREVPV